MPAAARAACSRAHGPRSRRKAAPSSGFARRPSWRRLASAPAIYWIGRPEPCAARSAGGPMLSSALLRGWARCWRCSWLRAGPRLERSSAALAALGPQATLDRGYAIVRRRSDGAIVRGSDQAPAGERLALRVARGEIAATGRKRCRRGRPTVETWPRPDARAAVRRAVAGGRRAGIRSLRSGLVSCWGVVWTEPWRRAPRPKSPGRPRR